MTFKVIHGPPCSGKSTYARKNMGMHDVLFDYDAISSALTNDNSHTVKGREYAHRFVMDMRSAYVDTAKAGKHIAQNVWFLITNLNDETRQWLEPLSPEYIRMEVREAECLHRLDHDDTRPDKAAWAEVIKKWFQDHVKDTTNNQNIKSAPRIRGCEDYLSNEKQYRSASWEASNNECTITGYAVVFEQRTVLFKDPETGKEYGEVIDRHALDGADMSDVVLRYNHTGRVLARTRNGSLRLTLDDYGLRIDADMSQSDEAKSHYQDIKNGLVDKMSFAFTDVQAMWDPQTHTRRILKIGRLMDVALVDFPAYNQTEVSARSHFEPYVDTDRASYRAAQVRTVHDSLLARIGQLGFCDEDQATDYRSQTMIDAGVAPLAPNLSWNTRGDTELDPIKHEILKLRDDIRLANTSSDLEAAAQRQQKLTALELQWQVAGARRNEIRKAIANGAGEPMPGTQPYTNYHARKEDANMNPESREFYGEFIEKRAAGSTGTMSKVIPTAVIEGAMEKAPNVFLNAARITSIAHNGNLVLPIAALQPIDKHDENAEISDAGYVPGTITIVHDEYCYQTGYSDLGLQLSASSLEGILQTTIVGSMLKKMDGICLGAIAGQAYTAGTNAVQIASGAAPDHAAFVELAGYLGSDFLANAKWYMHPITYFTWLLGLKDSNGRPLLPPGEVADNLAFCGFGISLDSQIPAKTVYFGDATRIHLNYARSPELKRWTDHDHNTEKFSIRAVAGAAAEPGCMVKMYVAG